MKMKIVLGTVAAIALTMTLISCSDRKHGESLFPTGFNFPTVPKFLIAIDGASSGTNVNVFPVNPTTGTLGSQVSGGPVDLGITDAISIVVHRNGHFVYAANGTDGS